MGFPSLVAIVLASRLMQSLLLASLALLLKVVPVYLRQHFAEKADCGNYSFVLAALDERYQFVQCGPGVSQNNLTNQWQVDTFL